MRRMTTTRPTSRLLRRAVGTAALALFCSLNVHSSQPPAQEPERFQPPAVAIPPSAERAYRALSTRVDGVAALEIVRHMDQFWRIAGNPGFNHSIDYIRARLLAAGFAQTPEKGRPFVRVEEWGQTRGWDYQLGTVAFADDGEVVLSRLRDRVSLCINSFSTPKGGLTARLVDVGDGGQAADYDNLDVKGAVVLGDADAGRLWQHAVKARGAVGVISTRVAPYIRPSDPKLFTSPDQHEVFQWGSIPYDADVKGFGFKASWRAASRMRERLKSGPVELKIDIASTFYDAPTRTLVAEIPGTIKPDERIVMAAHIQEPGANDDGSGCGTLYALAAALGAALEPPGRTLTFLWLDEIRGSRQWLGADPERAKGVQYMFSLDMTGEDTAKTGGTFLIEKQADPSAVWARPSDPHTEWGAGSVKAESLKGSLLNDLHLAVSLRRAKDTKWVVRTNPYEGGSDHTRVCRRGHPVGAQLALHRPLLPHQPRSPGQDERGRDGQRRGGGGHERVAAGHGRRARRQRRRRATRRVRDRAAGARSRSRARRSWRRRLTATKAEATEAAVLAAWRKWYARSARECSADCRSRGHPRASTRKSPRPNSG